MFENSQAFCKWFKQLKLASELDEWKEKVSQGRLGRADSIVSSLSSSHLVNFHLSDNLVKFVLKARLQLLECNSLLHTYYPGTYPKSCSRCCFYADTVSHALNGCRESKNSSQQTCLYSRAKCERPIFPCDDLGRSDCPAVIL